MISTYQIAERAKKASVEFSRCEAKKRNLALRQLSENIQGQADDILSENAKDVAEAVKQGLSSALVDRLTLNAKRIDEMAKGVNDIGDQDEVVGLIVHEHTRADGLIVKRQRVPLGVIGMIFESRPNVVVDCAALAIKSGNAIVLKGGSEARHSNRILCEIVRESIHPHIPRDIVQLIEDRDQIGELLKLNQFIDVMIPRGGEKLIEYVYNNAKMPVIAHFKGLCHGYIHEDADLQSAHDICINAKAQRPGVCNAMETLLLHKNLPSQFITKLFSEYLKLDVRLRLDSELMDVVGSMDLKTTPTNVTRAQEPDWSTEYLDKILAVKMVSSLEEAITHIQKYGTRHTEFICTQSSKAAEEFQQRVDASCVLVNASSRFNDGGELGLGAEIGISTTKIHAYGPMGAREMTIERFLVEGRGHIRT